jgi:hypothetical protein
LLYRHIASYRGDGGDADVRRAEGHDQSYGVVRGGVGVDEKCACHAG